MLGAVWGVRRVALMSLAAVALPALVVTILLGTRLVTVVASAEFDFDEAITATQRLAQIRTLIERERGIVTRMPGELDLKKLDAFAEHLTATGDKIETEIAVLNTGTRLISREIANEFRLVRHEMKELADEILLSAKSFSQSHALELVDGPFDVHARTLFALLDAVASKAESVVERAHAQLRASSRSAWQLTPMAVIGVLAAIVFGVTLLQRKFLMPLAALTDYVVYLTDYVRRSADGELQETLRESVVLPRRDEIGALAKAFSTLVGQLAEARGQLLAKSEADIEPLPVR